MNVIIPLPASAGEVVGSGVPVRLDEHPIERYPDEPANGVVPDGFNPAGGYFIVARDRDGTVGRGAFRPFEPEAEAVEVKQLYVPGDLRGHGIYQRLFGKLEKEVRSYRRSILKTGNLRIERCGRFAGSKRSVRPAKAL